MPTHVHWARNEIRVYLLHFLTGSSLFSHPEPEMSGASLSFRWRYVQELRNQIFEKLKVKLFQQLRHRQKLNETQSNINLGDVVPVEDHSFPAHIII